MTEDSGRESLVAVAATLTVTVDGLRESVDSLVKRAQRSERVVASVVVTVIVDLLFTVGLLFLWHSQTQTSEALDDTRSQVLCPLYAVFLGAYNPDSRAPGLDRQKYEDVFTTIRRSYVYLQCTTPLVPKPTPTTSAPPK